MVTLFSTTLRFGPLQRRHTQCASRFQLQLLSAWTQSPHIDTLLRLDWLGAGMANFVLFTVHGMALGVGAEWRKYSLKPDTKCSHQR